MKNSNFFQISVIGFIALLGLGNSEVVHALTKGEALRKASGIYEGTFAGPNTTIPGSVRVPTGTGNGIIVLDATGNGGSVVRLRVRFTRAIVKQGGARVDYRGRVLFPASLTQGFGSVSGTFNATVFLTGTPRMKGTARLGVGGEVVTVRYAGSK